MQRKSVALVGIAGLLSILPYSVEGTGGALLEEQALCAQTGFCVEAGCGGGRDYCYQPPSGGMCFTTAKPPIGT